MTSVAIDTNIFEHLLNRDEPLNKDGHIDTLLGFLQINEFALCVDNKNKIEGEYARLIVPIIESRDETGIERYILSYWMLLCPREVVNLDLTRQLMQRIRLVIPLHESVDQAFVYVACDADCKLVTNDQLHIITRKPALDKHTKKLRGRNTDFLTSRQAVAFFLQQDDSV